VDREISEIHAVDGRVAHEAGLNGWELDRLLFNFRDKIMHRLQQVM
jgi:hypothetical protein